MVVEKVGMRVGEKDGLWVVMRVVAWVAALVEIWVDEKVGMRAGEKVGMWVDTLIEM